VVAPPPERPMAELQLASLKAAADAINQHDARKYAAVFTRDAIHKEAAAADVVGRESIARRMQLLFNSFPDFKLSFDRVWQKGNVAVATWHWNGTDSGGFLGEKPTGKKAGVQGVSVGFYKSDGLVREIHVYEDGVNLVQQLNPGTKFAYFRAPPADAPAAMEVIVSAGGPDEAQGLAAAKTFYDALEAKKEPAASALFDAAATVDDFALPPRAGKGPGTWKALYAAWLGNFGAFTELPLYNQLAVNDYVISERVLKGTLGSPVSLHCIDIFQQKEGKILHFWTWSNTLELVAQVGKRGVRKP
jgi:steroid delta-isomerase-like uncharacterized protein